MEGRNYKNLSNVSSLLQEYDEKDHEKLEYIKNVLDKKGGQWDRLLEDENGNKADITLMLLYEYSTSIERMTENLPEGKRIDYRFVVDKLDSVVEKLRLGELRQGDENIPYGKSLNDKTAMLVKSDEFNLNVRAKGYGAGNFDYINENGDYKRAIAIFGQKTVQDKDGNDIVLSGSDFKDLSDLRQTLFHEWTHVMEMEFLTEKDFMQRDLPQREYTSPDGRTFKNYEEVKEYIEISIDENGNKAYQTKSLPEDKHLIISTGLVTDEPQRDIKHNQVTEGFVELVAREIMTSLGIPDSEIDKSRYFEHTQMALSITKARDSIKGEGGTFADFLTHSTLLKKELEQKEIECFENGETVKKDGLHYIGDYANKVKAGKTGKWDVMKQMPRATDKLKLTQEQRREIENHKFWSIYDITQDDIDNLREMLFSRK